jgi:hypothetical protein
MSPRNKTKTAQKPAAKSMQKNLKYESRALISALESERVFRGECSADESQPTRRGEGVKG